MQRPSWLVPGLFIIVIIVGFYILATDDPIDYVLPKQPEKIITTYMTDVTATRYNLEGRLQERLQMSNWSHYAHQAMTTMTDPKLTLYRPNNTAWKINAQQGAGYHLSENQRIDEVTLMEDVRITRYVNGIPTPWTLNTDILHLTKDEAYTEMPAILQGPGETIIKSLGAWANLNSGDIQLHSAVESQYDTAHL